MFAYIYKSDNLTKDIQSLLRMRRCLKLIIRAIGACSLWPARKHRFPHEQWPHGCCLWSAQPLEVTAGGIRKIWGQLPDKAIWKALPLKVRGCWDWVTYEINSWRDKPPTEDRLHLLSSYFCLGFTFLLQSWKVVGQKRQVEGIAGSLMPTV